MPERRKILVAAAMGAFAATAFFWFALAVSTSYQTKTERPPGEEHCLEQADFMRAGHGRLLYAWRERVLYLGDRVYLPRQEWPCGEDSQCRGGFCQQGSCRYEMSLSYCCLACHRDKERFCDACHGRLSVAIDCWQCHWAGVEE